MIEFMASGFQTATAITIRDAVETDLPAIVEIYNAAIPTGVTAEKEPVSVESRFCWFHEHTTSYRPIWVMEVERVLAKPTKGITGWLSFQSFSCGRPAYQATAEISIYIAPTYRGYGLGRQLLTEAIRKSPSFGLKTLVGLIFAHNKPSLHLFEALSFQRWGYLPRVGELDGVERDLIVVGRRLTE